MICFAQAPDRLLLRTNRTYLNRYRALLGCQEVKLKLYSRPSLHIKYRYHGLLARDDPIIRPNKSCARSVPITFFALGADLSRTMRQFRYPVGSPWTG